MPAFPWQPRKIRDVVVSVVVVDVMELQRHSGGAAAGGLSHGGNVARIRFPQSPTPYPRLPVQPAVAVVTLRWRLRSRCALEITAEVLRSRRPAGWSPSPTESA